MSYGEVLMGGMGVVGSLMLLAYTNYILRRLRRKESASLNAFIDTARGHLTFHILAIGVLLYTGGLLLAGTIRIFGVEGLYLPAKYVSAAGALAFLFFLREMTATID